MKTKMRKFGAWLMAMALAFAGAGAYGATVQVANQDELNAAVKNAAAGDVIEITVAATYKVPSPTSAIKIVGVDGVVFNAIDAQYGQSVGQATGTEFENVKFAFGTSLYTGFQHSSYVAFTKCSFTGRFNSYGEMHFTECSFEAPSSDYSMWLYAGDTYFKDCTFSGNGKFFNVYNEGNTTVPWIVEFDGCSFESTTSNKAALNVKSTCGSKGLKYDVRVNNCKLIGDNFPAASASDSLIVFNGLIQLDDIKASVANEITITQDGKVLYADNAVAEPEVVIAEPTKEAVVEKTVAADDVTPEQKAEKADEVVAVIAEAAEKETLEVSKSGLSEAGKTADGKLADPLVEALKTAAGEEKKDEITNETKVKKTIDVVFKGMTVEAGEKVTTTKIAYDVTPKATATLADGTPVKAPIPNGTFGKINFRMPLTKDFAGRWLKVSRTDNGTDFVDVGLYQAQKDGDVDFVQVEGDHFTTYVNEISDVTPVASINGKGYTTLADALKAVQPGETIKLVAEAEWNDANQIRATGFTLTSDGERKKIKVYKTMLFGGDNIKLDNIEFAAAFYEEISMVSCNTGRKTSFEVSNCKFTGLYYSTSFQPIGCAKITNCEFKNGFRAIGWAYAYGDGVDIENCKISGVTYGIHFDGGDAPVRVKNCEIAAWSSYGGISSMSFEGCKFKSARYNCVPAYVDTTFVNCEFDSDFECYAQATGFHWTFSGCKFGGAEFTESVLKENFEDSDVWEKCLLTIDGDKVRHTTESAAVKYVADPTDWLAEGYCAKQGADGKWTVAESVAEIVGGRQYDTLAKALAAVGNGQTVKVLKSGNVVTEYPKTYGEAGYDENDEVAGKNRLVISTDAKFTLDLNGKTLCGRLNLAKGDMTVANGTILSASQAITLYGSQDYETREAVHAALTFAADATIRSDFAGLCFFTGPTSDTYNPIGFGVRAKVYGKVYGTNPIYVSGNCGRIADSGGYGIEDLVERSGMSFFDLLDLYGVIIDIEDGAVLDASGTVEGDSTQGITLSGYVTVNVKGGTISGSEAIGMKGGRLNVTGGMLIGLGPKVDPIIAVDSGSETSGAGISASTYYNENYPIHINVTGGRIESKNNSALLVAHSRKESGAVKVTNGITASVSGGTFMGGTDQSAILVEPILEGEGGKYPANFISAKLDEEGKETGYPLCNSPIPAEYIAPGYVEKDNKDGTWTVTAGSVEIKTDTEDARAEPIIVPGKDIGQQEAQQAAEAVKESIVEAMKDPEVAEVTGTGIKEAAYEKEEGEQVLKPVVVEALQKKAVDDSLEQVKKDYRAEHPTATDQEVDEYAESKRDAVTTAVNQAITKESKAETTVEVKLDEVKVSVDLSEAEGQTLETTLTSAKFDVKPVFKTTVTIGGKTTITETTLPEGTNLGSPITFPLWLNSDFLGQVVKVTHKHESEPDEVTTEVVKISEGGRKYVEQTWSKFSIALVEAMETSDKACWANNEVYDKVADALAVTGVTEVYLLKDCAEEITLGDDQKIIVNRHVFSGEVHTSDGNEMVRGADGTIYVAPEGVNVPVGDNKYVKVRGYTAFPEDVTTPEAKGEYLAAKPEGASLARWQTFVMGVPETTKLVPQIVGTTTEGISTVVIKAQDCFPALNPPAKCGMKTVFRLMKANGTPTGYSQYGVDSNEPHFQVDVKEIAEKTFWKIQTSFKSTEVEAVEVED